MDSKRLRSVEIKNADQGEVSAVFSTFDVIDSDGDVTMPDAFTEGAPVRISAYGHASWGSAPPVGRGTIRTTSDEAILDGQFFMGTTAGRDTFELVKQMGDLQEWSYGFDTVEADQGERDGRTVQILRKLTVHEVSPVMLGAGVNTRTLDVKAGQQEGRSMHAEFRAAIRPHETAVKSAGWDPAAVVAAIPDDATVTDLRSVFAWVDGDPEAKSSYRFPHHEAVGGPANVRALVAGIAALNKGTTIPDRAGVYEHLAGHLRDADREPPELRTGSGGPLKFSDEAASVMADVSALVTRAAEVMALRSTKGRGMAPGSAELLEWITDDLDRLRTITNPIDEIARQHARFIALSLQGEPS